MKAMLDNTVPVFRFVSMFLIHMLCPNALSSVAATKRRLERLDANNHGSICNRA